MSSNFLATKAYVVWRADSRRYLNLGCGQTDAMASAS